MSESIRDLKANSSRYMSETTGHFAWQDGYAAISVSPSQMIAVRAYIDGQELHHAKRTYEHEITALLEKSGISYEREHFLVMSPLTRLGLVLAPTPGTDAPGSTHPAPRA